MGVHAAPQAVQSFVVSSVVQTLPHVVSVQMHVPLEQVGVGWAHVPLTQLPVRSQV